MFSSYGDAPALLVQVPYHVLYQARTRMSPSEYVSHSKVYNIGLTFTKCIHVQNL
jgi:hypothetical protein